MRRRILAFRCLKAQEFAERRAIGAEFASVAIRGFCIFCGLSRNPELKPTYGKQPAIPTTRAGAALAKVSNPSSRRERIFLPILVVDDDPFRAFARCTALETVFYSVTRAATASEAFLKLDEPSFAANVALVIVGLRLPGVSGPAFVRALVSRLRETPILVLGQPGEIAQDYPRRKVRFLPAEASPDDILRDATDTLAPARAA